MASNASRPQAKPLARDCRPTYGFMDGESSHWSNTEWRYRTLSYGGRHMGRFLPNRARVGEPS